MFANSSRNTLADHNNKNFMATWYKVCIIILMILSLILNLAVVAQYFYFRKKFHRNVLFKRGLICSLACSDALQSSLGFSLQLSSMANGFRPTLCQASAFIVTLFAYASIFTIVILNIEKCIHICFPWLKIKMLASRSTCQAFFICFAWGYAIFWAIFPLFKWNDYSLFVFSSCTLNWDTDDKTHRDFVICIMVFCFILPFILSIVCNTLCKRTLQSMKRYARTHFGPHSAEVIQNAKAESKAAHIAWVMAMATLFAWTPYSVLALLRFCSTKFNSDVYETLGQISSIIAKSSCMLNPIIYAFEVKAFRQELRTMPFEIYRSLAGNVIRNTKASANSSNVSGTEL